MKLVRDSLLRRYTPPTCTLELWQLRKVWQGLPKVLPADYRFVLHFDDPRLTEEQQTTIRGTPTQLDALDQTVEGYVQTQLSRAFCPPTPGISPKRLPPIPSLDPKAEPSFAIHPRSAFCHHLKVTTGDGLTGPAQAIALTTSQLYDLTTALEQFRSQEAEAKSDSTTDSPWGFWRWSAIALGSLVAIGVTGALVRQWQPQSTVVDSSIAPVPGKSQFQFNQVMPAIPPPPRTAPDSPQLAPTLALRDPLPPPPTVTPTSPPPRNPEVALVLPPERIRPPALIPPPPPGQSQIAIPSSANLVPLVPPDAPPLAPGPDNALAILPRRDGRALPYSGTVLPTNPNFPAIPQAPVPTFVAPPSKPLPPRSENLLDTIPQVGEVRKFYQQQWQPTEGQTQTLEYRLKIRPDGQIEKMTPLGKAASLYLSQLPQPPQGKPLVSPLAADQSETIRLVLTPLGDVKTFLED